MSRSVKPLKVAQMNWHDRPPSAEASLIFIDGNQLIKRWQAIPKENASSFIIAEIGFGCGLNFLQACALWEAHAPPSATLHYISSEEHPLTHEDLSRLWGACNDRHIDSKELLRAYPPLIAGTHLLEFNQGRVKLTLMFGAALASYEALLVCGEAFLEKTLREYAVDAWFLDAMISSHPLFSTMSLLSKETTTLVSSVTQEPVQQGLRSAGFDVQVSRQTLVATYQQGASSPLKRHTPWHVGTPAARESKHALVLGAGLSGCYTAYSLARRGWSVSLLDSEKNISLGASGNQQAVLYPKFSAFHSPLNDFMQTSYLYAIRVYQGLMAQSPMGEFFGILQLAHTPKEVLAQEKLSRWLVDHPMLGRLVNAHEASILAGITLQSGGLFVPQSGWIDMRKLCQSLVKMPGIQWIPNTKVTSLAYEAGEWHANGYHAKVLVLANGEQASSFQQSRHLPLQPVRGQMSSIMSDSYSESLRIPLCADGHFLPAIEGQHSFGATYYPGDAAKGCDIEDDRENLERLYSISIEWAKSKTITGHWAGVRAATPDYLPLVGPVAQANAFKAQFKGFATDAKRWIPSPGIYYEGLYVAAGFGSRGLTTIPLCAEWLARTINKEPAGLSRTMVQSFSPARFLRREIIRTDGVAILKPSC